MKKKIEILHEDEDLIVLNKPANYLSIPDRFKPELPNLLSYLKSKYPDLFVVHRLDRETSGVICFARNAEAHKSLSMQFEKREVDKKYFALVEGTFSKSEGKIDRPIGESRSRPGKMVIAKKGKESLTEYVVIEEFKYYTLLEVSIKTGRQHQIRVHMKAIGHPLAVDGLYNRKNGFYLSNVKRGFKLNKYEEERPLMSRTSLHARSLKIRHPRSGEVLEFKAALPKDFKAVLNQLRKWGR